VSSLMISTGVSCMSFVSTPHNSSSPHNSFNLPACFAFQASFPICSRTKFLFST
jgi:hypothetical protein